MRTPLLSQIHDYYNAVDDIFKYVEGEYKIRHDHSFAYRHRNKKHFAYQDFTYQETTGLINMIYNAVFNPQKRPDRTLALQFFADWKLALFQSTNSKFLELTIENFNGKAKAKCAKERFSRKIYSNMS